MDMRPTLLVLLKALCAWQMIVLLIGVGTYLIGRGHRTTALSASDSRLVDSLLRPSESDLRKAASEVSAVRGVRRQAPSQIWEAALASCLQSGRFDAAVRLLKENAKSIQQPQREEIEALLNALAERQRDIEIESSLAVALSEASYRFAGLEEWTWRLWDRAETSAQRARITSVLAVFHDGTNCVTLHRAALRFTNAASKLPVEDVAWSILVFAADLAEANQTLPALALYREVERLTSPGSLWGQAVFNQGLLLHRAGDQAASRKALLRLIASRVNDREAGGSLMQTNRNYRHWAANLIADTYVSDGLFPYAYLWRLHAAERYGFYSWCGTCESSASCNTVHLTTFPCYSV